MTEKQWLPDANRFYIAAENGQGIVPHEIAYRVLGDIAFQHVVDKTRTLPAFAPNCLLRVGDVGCFFGASTHRWLSAGAIVCPRSDLSINVKGADIYPENICVARERFRDVEHLTFEAMQKNGPIPLIDKQPYHLIFSTFVVDTISTWADVVRLCRRMVNALSPNGELYLLRLHPLSLTRPSPFPGFRLHCHLRMNDGDCFGVELMTSGGQDIIFEQTYWSTESLREYFEGVGCQVQSIDLSFDAGNAYQHTLVKAVKSLCQLIDLAGWVTPFFQILRVIRA